MSGLPEGFLPKSAYVIDAAREWAHIKLSALLIPKDAATARMPEADEEPKMVPLFVPPQFEVNKLIEWAKNADLNVEAMKRGVHNVDELQIQIAEANNYRLRAIALHLGIEEVR